MLQAWLKAEFEPGHVLYIAIDRTNWGCINLLMISLIWDNRAYPLYWELLPKQGNSNLEKQIAAISKVIPLFQKYKIVVLGNARILFSQTWELACGAASVLLFTSETK